MTAVSRPAAPARKRINAELAETAERAVRQAERVIRNARRKLASSGQSSGRARAETN